MAAGALMIGDRLDEILEVLMAYARQDFSPRIHVSERLDELDAIATGINLLAEELDGEVASRRELEAAYARLQATQTQLVIAERFAAVGQLANGVAHELNNPATWVSLGLSTIERRLARAMDAAKLHPAIAEELVLIERSLRDSLAGVDRMRGVIADLQTLSRMDRDVLVPLDVSALVRATCQFARPAYASVAELELHLEPTPTVLGDPGRLGQMVTNLVVNAAHAVADREGPQRIMVSTTCVGDLVVLAVDDTGPGIPDELRERVFEPHFTTKPSTLGSGLGLSIVRDIASRHHGSVAIMRSHAGGARVEIRLPVTDRAVTPAPDGDAPSSSTATSRARVLLIDDEPLLLRSLREAVDNEHEVVTALGGGAAIELLQRDTSFDLVVCDLQMPDVDGVSVHEAIAIRAPELMPRFVVMTGGAVTPRAANFMLKAKPRSLKKPISLDELLELARLSV